MRIVVIRFRGARLVRKLPLQVYKNICNNIFNFGNLLVVPKKLVNFFFHIVSSQTTSYVAQMQYMYDFLQTLFHTAILGDDDDDDDLILTTRQHIGSFASRRLRKQIKNTYCAMHMEKASNYKQFKCKRLYSVNNWLISLTLRHVKSS